MLLQKGRSSSKIKGHDCTSARFKVTSKMTIKNNYLYRSENGLFLTKVAITFLLLM